MPQSFHICFGTTSMHKIVEADVDCVGWNALVENLGCSAFCGLLVRSILDFNRYTDILMLVTWCVSCEKRFSWLWFFLPMVRVCFGVTISSSVPHASMSSLSTCELKVVPFTVRMCSGGSTHCARGYNRAGSFCGSVRYDEKLVRTSLCLTDVGRSPNNSIFSVSKRFVYSC